MSPPQLLNDQTAPSEKRIEDCGVVTLDKSHAGPRTFSHYAAIWVWVGWLFFYVALVVVVPILLVIQSFISKILLTALVGIIIISAVTTIDREKQPKWGYQLGEWAMFKASEFFRMKVIVEDVSAISSSGPAIFAMEPHDVLPLSIFSFNDCLGAVKGHKCLGCVTSACFAVPIMRHIYTWVNAHSIDKKSLVKMLRSGISPVICPGGVQEVTLMENEDECVLYLNSRLGFVKLAMQFGVPIVPVFSFGLRKSYSFWAPKSKIWANIGRKIGFLPMMIFGMWGLPMGPPKECEYTNVIGRPIPVPQIAEPTQEDVKKYHALYVEALTALFEKNKARCGMAQIKLRIA